MSVAGKSAHVRRVNARLPRPDRFYIFDDADGDSNESGKTKCANNSTQTKSNQSKQYFISKEIVKLKGLRSPHTLETCIITPRKKLKRKKAKLMDWKTYHRLNVIYSFIDDLEKDFPAICTVTVIGKSVQGRDIKMLKVSNSNAGNAGVWLDACIHPREWITTAVVTYMANVLVRNFHTLSTAVTNKDWHIVPVLNPDGYEYTHTHERMWRKNRATYGGECVGVDLNRNFSYAWGQGEGGSSDEPKHVFYRGPAPFSEPETVAVRDTILGSITPFKVFLSFHSYFELIIFPWGNRTDPCPDYIRLLEGGSVMARVTPRKKLVVATTDRTKLEVCSVPKVSDKKAILETTGKTYRVGSTKDLTYCACGTSIDWSYSIANIPYSYMVELRSRKYKFRLPKDQILDNCTEAWNAVQKLMDYVDEH